MLNSYFRNFISKQKNKISCLNWGFDYAYNNSYYSRIQIVPFEALYERRYRFSLYWDDLREKKITWTSNDLKKYIDYSIDS